MKKRSTTPENKITTDKVTQVMGHVFNYMEEQGIKFDKASLAKYVLLAIAIVYGIRKTNILGSLTISLITGLITKLLADKLENDVTVVQAERI